MRYKHLLPDGPADREHTTTTDCWCHPAVVKAGERTLKVTHHLEQEASDG